jgi:adenylate kinase
MSLEHGGMVVDFHDCDFFPGSPSMQFFQLHVILSLYSFPSFLERWFDRVVVLRTDNTLLFDRLKARNYADKKIQENVECEIMQVLLDQATESYREEVVVEYQSNDIDDMDNNVDTLKQFVELWAQQQ